MHLSFGARLQAYPGSNALPQRHSRVAYLLPGVLYQRKVCKFRGLEIDSLGTRLRSYRERYGLRQIDVACTLGVDEATIVHWEKAQTEPESRHSPKLTELLGGDFRPHSLLIWQRVKRFRHSLGLTQEEFATLVQVNESTVSRWEAGRGILPKRLLKMMGEEIVFHMPNSKMNEAQAKRWRELWNGGN